MCFYCCCSCCCNKFSARCVEFATLTFSLLSLICLILATFLIKKVHISTVSFVLLIILLVFFFLFLISISIIIIWRKKALINTTKNGGGICLSKLCLAFSIIGMIIVILWFALTRSSLYNTDHPCSSYSKPMTYDNTTNTIYFRLLEELTEEMEKFCEEVNDKSYYANVCNLSEYLSLYCISPVVFLFVMILTCLWHNDSQRITNKTDACVASGPASKVSRMSLGRFNINPNIFINDASQRRKQDEGENSIKGHKNRLKRNTSFFPSGSISTPKGPERRKTLNYCRANDSNSRRGFVFGLQNKNNFSSDVKVEDQLQVIKE